MKKLVIAGAAVAATAISLIGSAAAAQPYGYDYGYGYSRMARDSDRDGIPDRREWNRDRDRDGRPDQYDRYDNRRGGWRHHRGYYGRPSYGYGGGYAPYGHAYYGDGGRVIFSYRNW